MYTGKFIDCYFLTTECYYLYRIFFKISAVLSFLAMTVSKDPRYAKYFQMIKVVSFQKHSSQILLLIFQSSLRATSSCNDISSWLVEF